MAKKEKNAYAIPTSDKKKNEKENLVGNEKNNRVPFAVVEAYKTTRIHLISTLEKINGKVITVSSPNAAEGKSTTTINLAIAISQLNKKILIIDADTRRSTIHKKLKMENGVGCLDVITGNSSLEESIIKYNDHLDILTSGSHLNNPAELFSTDGFNELLDKAREKYDYILIDTPPINLVSDALVISQKCDGILVVVRADVTTYEAFNKTRNSLSELGINIVGVIINGTNSARSYRYSKYRKYGYGYYRYRNSSYYKGNK